MFERLINQLRLNFSLDQLTKKFALVAVALSATLSGQDHWSQFRGAGARGERVRALRRWSVGRDGEPWGGDS